MPNITTLLKLSLTFALVVTSQFSFAKFSTLSDFGDNPGQLKASYFIPVKANKNLVVLLHGCVQSGEQLAKQSGLLDLATAHQFSVLIPQQTQQNNIKSCFNWFSPQDNAKGEGETLSIINMVETLQQNHSLDNVYIMGLSAGGAMTSSLLVHYPTLFKGGAIIAGIPYPCANNLIKAISCMRTGPSQSADILAKEIQALNSTNKQWPTLSIWTGLNDKIVHPMNAQYQAKAWASVNGLSAQPPRKNQQGFTITQWQDSAKNPHIELIEIDNMSHGIAVNSQVKNGGTAADFVLQAPLSAAKNIIKFWRIHTKN